MHPFIEILYIVGRLLVGMWPIMFLVLLIELLKHRDSFSEWLSAVVKALALTWCFFALLRAFFIYYPFYNQTSTQVPFSLLPADIDPKVFLAVGLILLPLFLAILVEDYRKRYAVKTLEQMQSLSARDFEVLVAETYRTQGHQVDIVGAKGDHGIDLVVHTRAGETWLVQCKKYKGKVGEPIVREFYGSMKATEASAGAIVTTGKFTEAARLWAEGKALFLYDGDEFLKIVDSTRVRSQLPTEAKAQVSPAKSIFSVFHPLQHAVETAHVSPATGASSEQLYDSHSGEAPDKTPFSDLSDAPDCPACGTPMIVADRKRFLFGARQHYICQNAPDCKETRRID